MPRESWDGYFMSLAFKVSTRSEDLSTKVGAIIVGPDKGIRSTGYNGFPFGIAATKDRLVHPLKYKFTEHAERNAIFLMARRGDSSDGCTIFTTLLPCIHCARAIIQAGIIRVVVPGDGFNGYDPTQAQRDTLGFDLSIEMLIEAGVSVDKISATS